MTQTCSKCHMQLESPWKFCPLCGAGAPHEDAVAVERGPNPPDHEPAPVKRAFVGLFFGIVAVPVCIIFGTMLCMTGLGAILGIPMIILGAFAPLLGPMLGVDTHAGKCPWCEAKVAIVPMIDAFNCPQCHHKITIKNHQDMVQAKS